MAIIKDSEMVRYEKKTPHSTTATITRNWPILSERTITTGTPHMHHIEITVCYVLVVVFNALQCNDNDYINLILPIIHHFICPKINFSVRKSLHAKVVAPASRIQRFFFVFSLRSSIFNPFELKVFNDVVIVWHFSCRSSFFCCWC